LVQLSHPRSRVTPTPSHSEIDLSDGTHISWDQLYSELGPALRSYARSRGVRDPEDLVQDVFVDVFKITGKFSGDRAHLRSLFFKIAFRRIADAHRLYHRSHEDPVAEPGDLEEVFPTGWSPVEDQVNASETASAALRALSTLSEREQQVIRMRILEEASSAEVASRLGLTSINVRVIQARVLGKVRAYLLAEGHQSHPLAILICAPLSAWFTDGLPARGILGRWVRDVRAVPPSGVRAPEMALAAHLPSAVTWAETFPGLRSLATSATVQLGAAITVVAVSVGTVAVVDQPDRPTTHQDRGTNPISSSLLPETTAIGGAVSESISNTRADTGVDLAEPDPPTSPGWAAGAGGEHPQDPPAQRDSTPGLLDPITGEVISPLAPITEETIGVSSSLVTKGVDTVSTELSNVTGTVVEVSEKVTDIVSSTVDQIGGVAADATQSEIVDTTAAAAAEATEDVTEAARHAVEEAAALVDSASEVASNATDELVQAGELTETVATLPDDALEETIDAIVELGWGLFD
jgi:RNA polymerase sigma-70 factor (ECF subfamily)